MIIVLCCLMVAPAASAAGQSLSVVDGDTIDIGVKRYRIYGIDAPEAGQTCASRSGPEWPCGAEATAALQSLLTNKFVHCDDMALDDYGRMLAVCYADDEDVGEAMIRSGMAWAFRRYGNAYDQVEDEVRPTRIGVWQAPTEAPWDYRAKRWKVEAQTSPDGCPIKGNINAKGERIYHTPWSPSYANTRISPENGERWFCDEEEALAAGWRAPHGNAH